MSERLVGLFSRSVFPVALGGGVALTAGLLRAGVDPALSFVPAALGSYALVAVCERLLPYRRAWQRYGADLRVDLTHAVVSGFATLEALRPLALAGAVAAGGLLASHRGEGPWPNHWSLWLQLPLALVLGEFFMYWIHRLTHEVPWLWRLHATHHSAEQLYWLNSARFHPLDLALSYFCWWVPLVALGAGAPLIALYAAVTAIHGTFQHANLPLRLGPLDWVFSMAELHRWHHARDPALANRNYGQNLIVWDVVFGTRYLPRDVAPGPVGIDAPAGFPRTWLAQVLAPLQWQRITRAAERHEAGTLPL